MELVKDCVGKHVRLTLLSTPPVTGTVLRSSYGDYYIKLDKYCDWAHSCAGLTQDGYGFWLSESKKVTLEDLTLSVINKIKYLNNKFKINQESKGNLCPF